MAEALVSGLTDRLVEKGDTQLAAVLREFQPLLEYAERRQLKEVFVRNWLCDLKDAVSDLEDVLDEWDTALLRIKIQKLQFGFSEKVRFCILKSFLCFSQVRRVGQRRQIAVKMNELRERSSAIAFQRGIHGFNSLNELNNVGETEQIEQDPRLGSPYLIEESAIYGRDEDKKVLMNRLLSESSGDGTRRNVDVIPVVGIGGVGKTTLAGLVYNDDRVRTHFDLRIWVCVSEDFDVTMVPKAILEAILGQTQKLVELDLLIEHIHEAIAGKKFLLVLDDVWNEDSSKWELLRRPLDAGGVGSRILVTTRNESVARMMGPTGMITLGKLSEDDSWLIFSQIAFFGRDESENEQLEEIGREIVSKCHGLPLAAKAMGALMRFQNSRRQWECVLHDLMRKPEDVNTNVLDCLLLSYYSLSPALRRCFSYCAVFPKDYVIERDNLIKLWMSQGYLHFDRNKDKEILGQEYFMELAMLSFFQDFEKDHQGNIIRCKMHDLVHDLVQLVTKSECFIGVAEEYNLVTEKIRHCTFVRAPDAAFPVSTWNGKSLRTLFILGSTNTAINPAIVSHLSSLRTLELSDCWFKELPKEIGEFMHLRYLNLSGNDELESLPEKLCDLSNLQTLLIKDCMRLRRLPEAMGKLVNLRHLHIDWSFNLERLPKGIARLTSLQTLDMFVVARCDKNEALQLGDLKKLNKLEGYIRICKCGNIENVGEAEKAKLMYNKLLGNVKLDFDWSGERRLEDEIILECLQPHSNLEALEIRKYRGTTISPDWMMSLTNLRRLVLYSCQYSEALPPLGKLPSLESLEICLMKSVKNVGLEFLGIGTDGAEISSFVSFPKLSELRFSSLAKWKVWEGSVWSMEEDILCRILPCLLSLEINSCFCLDGLPNFLKKTPLQNLTITDSKVLQDHCIVGTGKEWDTISHIPNIKINFESVQRDDH